MGAQQQTGKVGIFWVWRGQLLAHVQDVNHAKTSADTIDSTADHVSLWPRFQQVQKLLRHVEYHEVPRGRVIYFPSKGEFVVYLDKTLMVSNTKSAIIGCFSLPKSRTSFESDPHYTTDAADLNRLFEQ
jgi:hypothetical protein